ncbi:hypothetical protein AB0F73_06515 [Micromonospora purpureochromogenes]|uniref:hypothetical protein n=1 Tax=Micromonospora purpureochromogenes TaxID=47872 RepID=UPI0033F3120B
MVYPAGNQVIAVRVERLGDQYSVCLRRSDGELSVAHGANVTGGLRYPGDVLLHLLANGVPMEGAAHCVEELEPGFDASAELNLRSETDMAAWRMADHLRREQLKAKFRRDRDSEPKDES